MTDCTCCHCKCVSYSTPDPSRIAGPHHVHGMFCDGQDHGRRICDVQEKFLKNNPQVKYNSETDTWYFGPGVVTFV